MGGTEPCGKNGNDEWYDRASSTHDLLSFVISKPAQATEELRRLRNTQAAHVELIIGFRTLFQNLVQIIDEAIGAETTNSP